MKIKKLVSLLLVMLMVTGLVACGNNGNSSSTGGDDTQPAQTTADDNGEGGEIEPAENNEEIFLDIMVHYGGETDRITGYAVEKVKEEFPNVTLRFEVLPSDGGQTVKTRAATGDLPDIILVDSGTIDVLAKSNSIIPLNDYVEEFNHKDLLLTSIVDNYLESPDGNIYQFPTGGISPILWYYNKSIFEENNVKVPENYDELLEAVVAFREAGVIPMAMFGKEPWPLGAFFDTFVLKEEPSGIYGLSELGKKVEDDAYQHALEKMQTLIDAGIFQDGATNTDFDVASAMFSEGQAAMFLNGSWHIADAYEDLGDDVDFIAFYPTADAGKEDQNRYAMTGGGDTAGLAVAASTPDQDLAAKVAARFAYYREVAEYSINQFVTAPIITEGIETENPLDPMSQKLVDLMQNYTYDSTFLHVLPNTKLATVLTEELQKFLVGESIETFTDAIDTLIDKSN